MSAVYNLIPGVLDVDPGDTPNYQPAEGYEWSLRDPYLLLMGDRERKALILDRLEHDDIDMTGALWLVSTTAEAT